MEDLPDGLDAGRMLFAQESRFLQGAMGLDHLPQSNTPEIAFAGRSNVGKSSLLNAVTGRTNLARTSNTPGRTQELNFFHLGSPRTGSLTLVDLPGYGYAKVSKEKVAIWTDLLTAYLRGRPNLRRALVLIDGRHGLKDSDRSIMKMMDTAAVSYQIVLTKADKVDEKTRKKVWDGIQEAMRTHVAAFPRLIATSSRTGFGIPELRAELAALTSPAQTT
jgi:GTP-binding protein